MPGLAFIKSYAVQLMGVAVCMILLPSVHASDLPHKNPIQTDTGETLVLMGTPLADDIFAETDSALAPPRFPITGVVYMQTTYQARQDDVIENNISFRNRIRLESKFKTGLTLSVLSDYLLFGSENESDEFDLTLHEARWEHHRQAFSLSIGKQIMRWGKTDQFSPVDTLNPEDFREFIIPDYEERKIPIWMAAATLRAKDFVFEGVVIPFFEPSMFHYFDTNWSVFGHLKKAVQTSALPPELKAYIDNLKVHETLPDNEFEVAFRLGTTIKEVDMAMTYHWMTEDTPFFTSFPIKGIHIDGGMSEKNLATALKTATLTRENIETAYKRTHAAGFEFETTWAVLGLRGETLWKKEESFLTADLTSVSCPSITGVLGVDYTAANNTYINVQLLYSHIYDYSDDILYFDRNNLSVMGEFKVDLISYWLQSGIRYNIGLSDHSTYISPFLKYTYITNLTCTAGVSLFSGDDNSSFGRYRNYDLFFLNLLYNF